MLVDLRVRFAERCLKLGQKSNVPNPLEFGFWRTTVAKFQNHFDITFLPNKERN